MSPERAKARRVQIGNAIADWRYQLFMFADEVQELAREIDGEHTDVADWLHRAAHQLREQDVNFVKAVEALQATAASQAK